MNSVYLGSSEGQSRGYLCKIIGGIYWLAYMIGLGMSHSDHLQAGDSHSVHEPGCPRTRRTRGVAPAWDLRLEGSRRVTGVSPRQRAEEVGV